MSYEYYLKEDYPTPDIFKDTYSDKTAFIIATGPSTSGLLKHKDNIKNKFDVIIGVNFSILDFDEYLDFFVCTENKPHTLIGEFKKGKYNKKIPRLVSYISIDSWSQDFNIFKVYRDSFNRKPNIREYKTENGEGLFKGYDTIDKAPSGVVLQAMHFATILGCNKIYIIGSELYYSTKARYYHSEYEHKHNLNPRSLRNEHAIVGVKIGQNIYKTLNGYKRTAHYINRFIEEECTPNKVEVIDFSDGLLTSARQENLDTFMNIK